MQSLAPSRPTRPSQGSCLIVEDSEFDSKRMSRVIHRIHGRLHVRVATTLRIARRMLTEAAPSFILLDNNLPDGLGADFASELASDSRLATIPVIMVSDWPSPFMWEKAESAGVLYVINKSEFDAQYVHAALKQARQNQRRLN